METTSFRGENASFREVSRYHSSIESNCLRKARAHKGVIFPTQTSRRHRLPVRIPNRAAPMTFGCLLCGDPSKLGNPFHQKIPEGLYNKQKRFTEYQESYLSYLEHTPVFSSLKIEEEEEEEEKRPEMALEFEGPGI